MPPSIPTNNTIILNSSLIKPGTTRLNIAVIEPTCPRAEVIPEGKVATGSNKRGLKIRESIHIKDFISQYIAIMSSPYYGSGEKPRSQKLSTG